MKDKKRIEIYKNMIKDIDVEIFKYKKELHKLSQDRKKIYLKIYYLKNKRK